MTSGELAETLKEQVSTPSQSKAERDTWQCLHLQDKSGTGAEILSLLSSSLLRPLWVFFFFYYYTLRQINSVFGLVIFWISTSWAGWLVPTSIKRLLSLYKFPATIKSDISVRFRRFIVLLMFVQGYKKNLQTRHDNISCSYHTMLFVQASINSMYCIYSIHFNVPITLYYIFLVRRTTNISNSKQVSFRHLNSLWWPCAIYVLYIRFHDLMWYILYSSKNVWKTEPTIAA